MVDVPLDLESLRRDNRWLSLQTGYLSERIYLDYLDINYIDYRNENPVKWKKWVSNQFKSPKPYDLEVKVKGEWKRVDWKFLRHGIYDSWLKRDWLTRECEYIVCNNIHFLTSEQRQIIRDSGKKLLDIWDFIMLCLNKYIIRDIDNACLDIVQDGVKLDSLSESIIKSEEKDFKTSFQWVKNQLKALLHRSLTTTPSYPVCNTIARIGQLLRTGFIYHQLIGFANVVSEYFTFSKTFFRYLSYLS